MLNTFKFHQPENDRSSVLLSSTDYCDPSQDLDNQVLSFRDEPEQPKELQQLASKWISNKSKPIVLDSRNIVF